MAEAPEKSIPSSPVELKQPRVENVKPSDVSEVFKVMPQNIKDILVSSAEGKNITKRLDAIKNTFEQNIQTGINTLKERFVKDLQIEQQELSILLEDSGLGAGLSDGEAIVRLDRFIAGFEAKISEIVIAEQEITTGKQDIVTGKQDIVTGKQDIVTGKQDIVTGKQNIVTGKEITAEAISAEQALSKIYDTLGGKDKLIQAVGKETYAKWEDQAKKGFEAGRTPSATEIELSILLSNQSVISKKLWLDSAKSVEFTRAVEAAGQAYQIPRSFESLKKTIPSVQNQAILEVYGKDAMSNAKAVGERVILENGTSIDFGTKPPKTGIEKGGLRAETGEFDAISILRGSEIRQKADGIIQSLKGIPFPESTPDLKNQKETISKIPTPKNRADILSVQKTILGSKESLSQRSMEIGAKLIEIEQDKGKYPTEKVNNIIGELKDELEHIQFIEKLLEQQVKALENLSEEYRKLPESAEPSEKKPESKEGIARSNLAFLENLGIGEFGMENFAEFVREFNRWEASEGLNQFQIDPNTVTIKGGGAFGYTHQTELAQFMVQTLNKVPNTPSDKENPNAKKQEPMKLSDIVKCDKNGAPDYPLTFNKISKDGKDMTILQSHLQSQKQANQKAPWTSAGKSTTASAK